MGKISRTRAKCHREFCLTNSFAKHYETDYQPKYIRFGWSLVLYNYWNSLLEFFKIFTNPFFIIFLNLFWLTFLILNRGLFIIDGNGILRQITMNDLPVGRSVDETLRLVQAFQYTDKNGEVCPAGWKPGSDTVSSTDIEIDLVAAILLFKHTHKSRRVLGDNDSFTSGLTESRHLTATQTRSSANGTMLKHFQSKSINKLPTMIV